MTSDPPVPSAGRDVHRLHDVRAGAKRACRKETLVVARELLGSRVADYRARACSALRDVGESSLKAQMRLLATTDPARTLETQELGYWQYALVTHPVRETCQQALNELALKADAKAR